ncbi:pentapeptide repeat-containing protein [bacterium]|nr:pentapeptide repeat-containing protein [bacterium]
MDDSPEKIEKLKERWMLDPSSGIIRPALIEALRALQDGEKDWERHLETVPYTDEITTGRDLRGVDFSSLRGMGLRYMRDGFLDLRDVDFYRTHLEYSNLYRIHLENANLYSAFLDGANLRNTHLRDAIIEFVSLENAKLQRVDLRGFDLCTVKHLNSVDLSQVRLTDAIVDREQFLQPNGKYMVHNEVKAMEEHARNESTPGIFTHFEQAHEVYLTLKNNFINAGKYRNASWAACKEKRMEKLLLWHHLRQGSYKGWHGVQKRMEYVGYSVFNALFMYGENPWRLIWWAVAVMLACALFYPISGFTLTAAGHTNVVSYGGFHSIGAAVDGLLAALYFSIITFTTVGYGDVLPVGFLSHFVAAVEALSGLLFFGLFVFTLGRKVSAR